MYVDEVRKCFFRSFMIFPVGSTNEKIFRRCLRRKQVNMTPSGFMNRSHDSLGFNTKYLPASLKFRKPDK